MSERVRKHEQEPFTGELECCTLCKIWKDTSLFGRDGRKTSGRMSWCRDCTRMGTRLSRLKQTFWTIKEFLEELFGAYPCKDCKETFEWCQLSFDHLDPDEKGFSLGHWGAYQATEENALHVLEEIEKCVVVCHNCHAVRTKRWHEEITARLDREAETYMIMVQGRE
jgi:hypothetical protein